VSGESENTWLVAGLGNPGSRYEGTYHNLGRIAAMIFAGRHAEFNVHWQEKYKGMLCRIHFRTASVHILLPETYMNLSGESVLGAAKMFKIGPDRLIVIHDDLDLDPGFIRIKQGGGDGGHRGLQSCILSLGTPDFIRIKIGIGRDPILDSADYVLSRVRTEHAELLKDAVQRAADAMEAVIAGGLKQAMNTFNRRQKKTDADDEVSGA
jgi:PTH1 family peptidyl-tRNA hydrolase